ncbi:MAG TPA: DNA mismatch repair endonuclease MutL [Phycisphaerae bacterium]|nr:DNA mismatch repair endonuclease MutL [Phycisphaerae bacterium]
MPRIQILSDLLVNKIAAGEVIERPASVVKELVENSLDAGATRVEVAVDQGGTKLIRVSDDGAGMDSDDLGRSVLPHATSKLAGEDDLYAIRTMGFRGEALASIGAVSQLRIVSRQATAGQAHEVLVVADRIEPARIAPAPPGTTVEVRELFFNMPARRKFLRTPQTEIGHITEQLTRTALPNTAVEFRLTHNGRLVHHLRPSESMRSRIADLYGADLADHLLEFSREERGLKISGFAGLPADSRSSTKWQYVFMNHRYIRDRFISHAIREAYRGLIEPNRYPVFFVALELDPSEFDVNVHPTKIEVRWRDSNLIYSQVLSALRDRLLNENLTPDYRTDRATPGGGPAADAESEELEASRRQQVRQSIAEFFKRTAPTMGPGGSSYRPAGIPGFNPTTHAPLPLPVHPEPSVFDVPAGPGEPSIAPPASLPPDRPMYRNIMQVHNAFLVAETDAGLTIVDQHALHERILYEAVSGQITRGPLESQHLLIPETIDVTADQVALIESHGDAFARLGFELSPYGPTTIAAHAIPSLLKPDRVRDFLRDALDRLADREAPASSELLLNDLISMMACKAAVKAGDPLAPEEIARLMSQRDLVERSSNCPHGRPTSLSLSLGDLEKQFKRV